jgi:hypothetical protein
MTLQWLRLRWWAWRATRAMKRLARAGDAALNAFDRLDYAMCQDNAITRATARTLTGPWLSLDEQIAREQKR